jgi:hypothetical protein
MGQPIKARVAVLFHVAPGVSQTDEPSGTSALMLTVTEGLRKRGAEIELYTGAHDRPPPPLIEITVNQWGPGDVTAREIVGDSVTAVTAGGFLTPLAPLATMAMAGKYAVVARFYRQGDEKPVCERNFTGLITSTAYTASADAGESVGDEILTQALSDSSACASPNHHRFGSKPP